MTAVSEQKGDLLIRYLWSKGMDYILSMRVVNIDAASYVQKTLDKSLQSTDKKCKFLYACLENIVTFTKEH